MALKGGRRSPSVILLLLNRSHLTVAQRRHNWKGGRDGIPKVRGRVSSKSYYIKFITLVYIRSPFVKQSCHYSHARACGCQKAPVRKWRYFRKQVIIIIIIEFLYSAHIYAYVLKALYNASNKKAEFSSEYPSIPVLGPNSSLYRLLTFPYVPGLCCPIFGPMGAIHPIILKSSCNYHLSTLRRRILCRASRTSL